MNVCYLLVFNEFHIVFTILFTSPGTRTAIFKIMEKYDSECGHSVPNHVDI